MSNLSLDFNILLELFSKLHFVRDIIQSAPTVDVAVKKLREILSNPLVKALEGIALTIWPQLAPEIHILAILTATDFSTVKLVQASLNAVGASPQLKEDGIFGPRTQEAIMAWQRKAGLPSTGFIADIEWALLTKILGGGG